jgi:hypothetical protein
MDMWSTNSWSMVRGSAIFTVGRLVSRLFEKGKKVGAKSIESFDRRHSLETVEIGRDRQNFQTRQITFFSSAIWKIYNCSGKMMSAMWKIYNCTCKMMSAMSKIYNCTGKMMSAMWKIYNCTDKMMSVYLKCITKIVFKRIMLV